VELGILNGLTRRGYDKAIGLRSYNSPMPGIDTTVAYCTDTSTASTSWGEHGSGSHLIGSTIP
jgi:hypothetical protein